jgi:cytochrome c5
MRVRLLLLTVGLGVITALPVISQNGKAPAKSAKSENPKLAASGKADDNSGEEKFQQNCSRCHNAPQSFPSHISGTIVKHMRVRASLSEEDAREILRFLNPQ